MTEFGGNLPKGVTVAKELALPAVKSAVPSAASAAPFGPADLCSGLLVTGPDASQHLLLSPSPPLILRDIPPCSCPQLSRRQL